MKLKCFVFLLIVLPVSLISQNELFYPVDIVYHQQGECYYVSNWADGNGYILKLNLQGEIVETFVNGLHFPGGMCLRDNILYYTDNLSIWGNSVDPSYLKGKDLSTGAEVLNFEISTSGTYLDLMDYDYSGNLYIGNSRNGGNDGIVHKFNLVTHELTNLVTGITKPFGVCFDPYSNRVLFTNSSASISYIRSVNTEGGQVTTVYYTQGYLEGIVMHPNADFYLSSWGTADGAWGNEPVIKTNHYFNWEYQLAEPHNRPFGMCIGKDNYLVVCNWGEHTLSFINLNLYGVEENISGVNDISIYPNPSNGIVFIKFNNNEMQENELKIHDMMGREVYREKINRKDFLSEKQTDLNHLPPGIYFISSFSDGKSSPIKLIIY